MAQPGFWDDNQAAQGVIDETNVLKQRRDNYLSLANGVAELADLHELLTLEDDADLLAELTQKLPQVQAAVEQYQLNQLLDGPYDDKNAILEIHPGAGGTEAQDWGEMLLRMYMRWADQHDFVVEVANYEAGEEAGVKSVTLIVKGHNAYGS